MLWQDARTFTCVLHACMHSAGRLRGAVCRRLGTRGVRAAVFEGILAMYRADPTRAPRPPTGPWVGHTDAYTNAATAIGRECG